ncbi:uncharacterized protein DS421_15g494890 [Arachis hypogaea]|nr:uncharacterized protein DS421_15g494890 [Arachis hypogaea]
MKFADFTIEFGPDRTELDQTELDRTGPPTRCVRSVHRQQKMILHDRILPYLDRANLLHVARLNDYWFKLDEPLISAFVERWRPETHTFHMPFGECTITLQDVAYYGCLSDFEQLMEGGKPAWVWFGELFGELPLEDCIDDFTVSFSWFQNKFRVLPAHASEETVQIYARGYIMMLLSTALFTDKSGARVHLRWLPYVADLDGIGKYSWASATLSWLYRCLCRVANRNVKNLAGPLSLLQSWIFWRFPAFRPRGFDAILWPLAARWGRFLPSSDEKGPYVIATRHRLVRKNFHKSVFSPSTKPKATGRMFEFPSWAIAISRVPPYFPYKWVPSMDISGLQYLNASMHGGNVQNSR